MIKVQLNVLKVYLIERVKINIINLMIMCYPEHTILLGENYWTDSLSSIENSAKQIQKYYKKYLNINLTS
ncbi:hypothetical protein ACED96_05515 [Clostridium thermobutyricum]|uniref:hypothetical protein n=1 Tax=uncultured Clostridium sp. TaxID=59620 RepID=UPI002587AEE2|nr:hypothetical protein [uncultured Clostridium sp.]